MSVGVLVRVGRDCSVPYANFTGRFVGVGVAVAVGVFVAVDVGTRVRVGRDVCTMADVRVTVCVLCSWAACARRAHIHPPSRTTKATVIHSVLPPSAGRVRLAVMASSGSTPGSKSTYRGIALSE